MLGIHYIKVRPERAQAFEQFVGRTLHPAVANLRPDLRLLYYKAVAGPDAGNYIALFALTRSHATSTGPVDPTPTICATRSSPYSRLRRS